MFKFDHTLVFGGTGMLRKATEWIAEHSTKTVVFGRDIDKLTRIKEKNNCIEIRILDYTDTNKLIEEINRAYKNNGPINTVIAWIHSTAPDALSTIKSKIGTIQDEQWTLLLVKGSSANIDDILASESDFPFNCHLKVVQLGFKIIGSHSRWLTHDEISNGVIESLKGNKTKTIVGTLHPWDRRP